MFILLPDNKTLNLGHIGRSHFELIEAPREDGKPITSTSKLTLAMSDGDALVFEGPVAAGLWGLIQHHLCMAAVQANGDVGIKQMNPNQIVAAPANTPLPKVTVGR